MNVEDVLASLHRLGEEKKAAILGNDVYKLEEILSQEQSLAPTLSSLLVEITDEEVKQELKEQVVQLRALNDTNMGLLKQSLQFVTMSLALLNPQPQRITYSRPHLEERQHVFAQHFNSQI
ncbi:hypothetical protein A374_01749 [Fictibacillus macauensis ZFHKF-1]|uniref:FlgN family protein n=1 Tax=Fictibacillus macauensis ZFHKF-1 TaxID=1196324 RepID=I8AMM8_9BACL|nr:flagellar export chaperone FlgN [Fictibacillus macauensis]EIT86939.1 hypothetical protein A374_01749 [Fictibacillus macauensis ZFHKF-1]